MIIQSYCIYTAYRPVSIFLFITKSLMICYFFLNGICYILKVPVRHICKNKKNRKTNYALLFFLAILLTFHIVLFISISLFFIRKVLR